MPVNLKIIPPAAWRPAPIRFGYWFSALGALVVVAAVTGLALDQRGESTKLWIFFAVAIMLVWLLVFVLRVLFWLFQHNNADGWDSRREETLLWETRRGRRALQILHASVDIPLPEEPGQTPVTLLMEGASILKSQTGRGREDYCLHTFFPTPPTGQERDDSLEPEQQDLMVFQARLQKLLADVAIALAPFSPKQTLAVLFEVDTSILPRRFIPAWHDSLKEAGIAQLIEYVDGHGAQFIDEWLDNRINDKSLLLIIAAQIAPEMRQGSAEAIVALLLGNRLTQNTVPPLAWLHRPERTDPQLLDEGIAQSADWVPLEAGQVKHLWLSGLTVEEASAVIPAMAIPLLSGVPSPAGRHNTDLIIGHAGCVSPWLAAAVATLAAQQTDSTQLAISADRGTGALWVQAITPSDSGVNREHKL
ncbi:hypothetical protein [Raoultella ornithinolytica]|uniref:hypothetical protein n=1 Tax=Raoultella ornithinolytica TaxID=54291 RepID=UPI0015DD1A32|nr:hypothetical protein [Raoultella ornithinolytica]MBK2610671.1 hypothetical protein [Raoultella ornithinolytica]QLK15462.1 hypothetical protein GPJ65_07135 [Raoultella ornithinolytica]